MQDVINGQRIITKFAKDSKIFTGRNRSSIVVVKNPEGVNQLLFFVHNGFNVLLNLDRIFIQRLDTNPFHVVFDISVVKVN